MIILGLRGSLLYIVMFIENIEIFLYFLLYGVGRKWFCLVCKFCFKSKYSKDIIK